MDGRRYKSSRRSYDLPFPHLIGGLDGRNAWRADMLNQRDGDAGRDFYAGYRYIFGIFFTVRWMCSALERK
jgi:hypothetical protein